MEFDDLKLLNETQKDLYMRFQRLFESDYWPLVVQHAELKLQEAALRQLNATNWDTSRITYGERIVWAQVANLQQEYENYFNQMVEDVKNTAESEEHDYE